MPEVPAVICVVDDDAMVRTALTRLLRAAGCPTEAFASAEAFLRRPHREVCTGLILDVDLPDQSGRKLAHSTTAAKSHMPIIVLTAREPSAATTMPFQVHDEHLFAARVAVPHTPLWGWRQPTGERYPMRRQPSALVYAQRGMRATWRSKSSLALQVREKPLPKMGQRWQERHPG